MEQLHHLPTKKTPVAIPSNTPQTTLEELFSRIGRTNPILAKGNPHFKRRKMSTLTSLHRKRTLARAFWGPFWKEGMKRQKETGLKLSKHWK